MAFTFGAAAPTNNTFGSFGTSQPTSTPAFGAAPTTSAPFGTSTGFGTNPPSTNTFSFGSSAPQKPGLSFGATTTSTFGGLGTNNTTGGFGANKSMTFGATGNSLFGANPMGNNSVVNPQRAQQVYQLLAQMEQEERAKLAPSIYRDDFKSENVWQALALLKSWWDPKSPQCRFKHYFYNIVPAQDVHLYQKPANHDQTAWDAAQAANPDPTKAVPALAIGFDDVQKRMDEQHKMNEAHKAKLIEIQTMLKEIQKKGESETETRLNEYKRRHMETVQRVIKFLKYAQVLRNKGLNITPDEEVMRSRLEDLQDQLQRSDQFCTKLSRSWAQLQLVKESKRKLRKVDRDDGWAAVSEENMDVMTKMLEEQNHGVQHLVEILENDTQKIDNLYQTWNEYQPQHYR